MNALPSSLHKPLVMQDSPRPGGGSRLYCLPADRWEAPTPDISKGPAMLTIYGQRQRLCDGVSRRSFLKIGGFALGAVGGVSLADLLRAESASGRKSPQKAVINI